MIAVLRAAGLSLALLFVLISAVLSVPVTLRVRYSGGNFLITVGVLFLRFRLFPKKTRAGKPKAERAKKPRRKKKAESGRVRAKLSQGDLIKLLPAAKKCLRRICENLHIRVRRFQVVVAGDDAADTGIKTGRVWNALCAASLFLGNVFSVRYGSVRVVPDFSGELRGKSEFDCKITAVPIIMVAAVLAFLFRFVGPRRAGGKDRLD